MPAPKPLSKEDILRAQRITKSNRAAARYLGCSYNHYKRYAQLYENEEGKTLFKIHLNPSGKEYINSLLIIQVKKHMKL
jgi:hypothetical protein